jgi:molecular chaperone DnaJ
MSNHHSTLGLQPGASQEDIKKAYRKLATQYHPDKQDTGDEEKFKQISEAYRVLSGKDKSPRQQHQEFSWNDPFRHMHNFMNNAAKNYNFHRTRIQKPPEEDKGVVVGLNLNIEEIKKGKEFKIEYKKSKLCQDCKGVGGEEKIKCSTCNGTGKIRETYSEKNISFATEFTCSSCGGAGEEIKNECKTCKGNGFVVYLEKLEFEVKEKKKNETKNKKR